MKDKLPFKILDVAGKTSIECPKCGFRIEIQPRTLGMAELRHMEDNRQFAEWQKKNVKLEPGDMSLGNVRMGLCPRCEQPILMKDQFTIQLGEEKKE